MDGWRRNWMSQSSSGMMNSSSTSSYEYQFEDESSDIILTHCKSMWRSLEFCIKMALDKFWGTYGPDLRNRCQDYVSVPEFVLQKGSADSFIKIWYFKI